jgi:hypothetical protein
MATSRLMNKQERYNLTFKLHKIERLYYSLDYSKMSVAHTLVEDLPSNYIMHKNDKIVVCSELPPPVVSRNFYILNDKLSKSAYCIRIFIQKIEYDLETDNSF